MKLIVVVLMSASLALSSATPEAGGTNRSSNGETPFLLVDATVTANGRTLVADGKLVGVRPEEQGSRHTSAADQHSQCKRSDRAASSSLGQELILPA